MTMPAIQFTLASIDLFERPVQLRLPFRFGVVTLRECPQAFARVRIRLPDGRESIGAAAEMMVPKWFDKNLALSNEDNFAQLRDVLQQAREAYLSDSSPASAFGHFARHYDAHQAACAARGHNPLLAHYGPALIDRAILDALCRLQLVSFYQAMQANLPGIDSQHGLWRDLDIDRFLTTLAPADAIEARHTVGLVDAITAADLTHPVNDGLPETLEQVISRYGHRYYKLKVSGDLTLDIERLSAIAAVLDRAAAPYWVTLDGNEQYESAEQVGELLTRMRNTARLQRLMASILFIEQPINRHHALEADFRDEALGLPVIIDESDATLDTYLAARARGYRGVSSKTCKGIYKSVLNAARCAHWNARLAQPGHFILSAEDLTTQAGLAVQQDLALVNLLGITHVERNGHHYVNGMAALPKAEQGAFLQAHPDLYSASDQTVRLAIRDGRIALGSLACPGFASAAHPDFDAMQAMPSIAVT